MDIKEIFQYVLPSLIVGAFVLITVGYKLLKESRKYEDYKNDEFRRSIEKQISELSNQLGASQERFQSINHLLMDAQGDRKNETIPKQNESEFFTLFGVDKDTKIDNKLIFVLTPFNEQYNSSYFTVKETVEDLGLKCSRGDDASVSHNILEHIIQEMVRARLIIANISGRNSNVFYELGIAHALGKPVLLISETDSSIPFDLSHIRTLMYRNNDQLKSGLKNWLVTSLAENT